MSKINKDYQDAWDKSSSIEEILKRTSLNREESMKRAKALRKENSSN